MRRLRPLTLALLAAFAVAAPASAAVRPIDLGPGATPDLLVGPDGTAHLLLRGTPDDGLVYCRLPRGARACDVRTALPIGAVAQYHDLYRRGAGVLIAVQT